MAKIPDYYAILGVARNASREEIKRAYLEAAQRLHPDKNKAAGETEIFLDVQQAYETLSNPASRKKYDASLPKEEQLSLPFKYKVYYSRPNLVRMDESQMLYVLLEIAPPEKSEEIPVPPLNVTLVLDRSTSMKDGKMDVLKGAAIKVMQTLRSRDIFSVVAFSDRAEVLIPASYPSDKRRLESRIQMLQPSGGTEMFQGLQTGYSEIQRNVGQDRIDHIILLTDGHTYGDEQQCLDLAERAAKQGIGISAMGIGKEWNDTFPIPWPAALAAAVAILPEKKTFINSWLKSSNRLREPWQTMSYWKSKRHLELRWPMRFGLSLKLAHFP
jgi:Ca-activated chloride channel family protein